MDETKNKTLKKYAFFAKENPPTLVDFDEKKTNDFVVRWIRDGQFNLHQTHSFQSVSLNWNTKFYTRFGRKMKDISHLSRSFTPI